MRQHENGGQIDNHVILFSEQPPQTYLWMVDYQLGWWLNYYGHSILFPIIVHNLSNQRLVNCRNRHGRQSYHTNSLRDKSRRASSSSEDRACSKVGRARWRTGWISGQPVIQSRAPFFLRPRLPWPTILESLLLSIKLEPKFTRRVLMLKTWNRGRIRTIGSRTTLVSDFIISQF